MKNIIDDGFSSELVADAFFSGNLEIPCIEKPKELIIPKYLVPFTKMNASSYSESAVHFYEHDKRFSDVLVSTKDYLSELKKFTAVISPDCSLYRDMPLCLQIANTYMNRAVGCYLQSHGVYVIPNVRWGDERSYTTVELPEKFAFLGVPKNSIVSIGTYGCIKSRVNKQYFVEGLSAMLDDLLRKWCLFTVECLNLSSDSSKKEPILYIIPTGFLLKEGGRHNGDRLFR